MVARARGARGPACAGGPRAAIAAAIEPPALAGVRELHYRPGGVDAVTFLPAAPRATILYFHGGSYRLGSPERSAAFAAELARQSRCAVVTPRYRLAPEHPFPAGLNDALAVYRTLLAAEGPVIVAGDSAGGGLASALGILALRSSAPAMRGLVLMSPWLDLTLSAESYASRAERDQLFSRESAAEAVDLYLQGHDPRDPLASPLLGDLAGLPPVLLFAGSEEVLLDDSLDFAARLARADVPVELHVVAGMQHVWPTREPDLPETATAFAAIGAFVASIAG